MTLFVGNLSKRGWIDGHREELSWSRRTVMDSVVPYLCNFFCCSLHTLEEKYDGPSQTRWSVEGLVPKTLQLVESGYWDHFSDLPDEPVGWTVIATTDRHKLRNPTLGQNSPSSFSSCTTMPPTDRHEHDELSQAPYVVIILYFFLKKPLHSSFRQISCK